MAETLADFARSIGVTPETARQWKRRGKITGDRDSGFTLNVTDGMTGAPGTWNRDGVTDAASVTPRATRRDSGVAVCPPVTHQTATPESCAGCLVQAARLESCEYAIEALRSDISGLRDHVAALEALIADLKAANRDVAAGQLLRGQTVRRNGRTEIADGDYLESQRWE